MTEDAVETSFPTVYFIVKSRELRFALRASFSIFFTILTCAEPRDNRFGDVTTLTLAFLS